MRELSMDHFKQEVEVTFGGERYLVRDNGAICRLPHPGKRIRRLDGFWTFGKQCRTSGYRRITGLPVHKIIATAFYGEQPSPGHVVDHLDTNRRNNRIENLRWVTRLENIVNNPKTLRRIEKKWGSIQGMLQDPNRAEKADPLRNRSWMPQSNEYIIPITPDIRSLTSLAVQRNWKTPNEFLLCPGTVTNSPLDDYFQKLQNGLIFSTNRYGDTLVENAEMSEDRLCLSVVTRISNGVKGWGLVKITFEEGLFVHAAYGTFFTPQGAAKSHSQLIGKVWEEGATFDDFC